MGVAELRRTLLLAGLGSSLLLGGCVTVVTETAKKALEDRTTQDQLTDTEMASKLLSGLANKPRFSIRRTCGAARSLSAHLGPFWPFFVAHSRAMGSSVRTKLTPNCARYRFAP